ncbi:hypothetical protein ACWDYK_10795 [Streptomyces anthocyanicus]|uniref:hypothetical protein n=1 Tax=Streptomyces TaxID=1883 RepID=UPI0013520950|nr:MULTISPECIES: hypothetical protein [Streptomyces]MDX3405722.1 hypothetical protein [Streptomyces sp. ME02-6977A]
MLPLASQLDADLACEKPGLASPGAVGQRIPCPSVRLLVTTHIGEQHIDFSEPGSGVPADLVALHQPVGHAKGVIEVQREPNARR